MSAGSVDVTLGHAARYSELGWAIFPCQGKRPLVKWRDESTTEWGVLQDWFGRDIADVPNIGIDCGKSGLVVVDVDKDHGGFGSLSLIPELPDTLINHTGGGGLHYVFSQNPVALRNTAGKVPVNGGWVFAPGIDIRAEGGYIIVPPSIHPSTGTFYRWSEDGAQLPLTAPDWLRVPVLASSKQIAANAPQKSISPYIAAAVRDEAWGVAAATEGQRNATLNRAAYNLGGLVGAGRLERRLVEGVLKAAALDSGLFGPEIDRTIRSGIDAGRSDPRLGVE